MGVTNVPRPADGQREAMKRRLDRWSQSTGLGEAAHQGCGEFLVGGRRLLEQREDRVKAHAHEGLQRRPSERAAARLEQELVGIDSRRCVALSQDRPVVVWVAELPRDLHPMRFPPEPIESLLGGAKKVRQLGQALRIA